MVGYDIGCITCPMCKTFKNTWQPFLPLGVDRKDEDAEARVSPKRIEPYIDFCSQLINNHLTSVGVSDRDFTQKSILAVDVKSEPEKFVLSMCSVVTYFVLESTCMNNQRLLTAFNPSAQQHDILLRDVVYLTMTTKEILRRLLCSDPSKHSEVLSNIGNQIMTKLADEVKDENVFKKNFQKLVVQLLFISAVCTDSHELLTKVKPAIVGCIYSSFKAQVLLSELFKKHLGQV